MKRIRHDDEYIHMRVFRYIHWRANEPHTMVIARLATAAPLDLFYILHDLHNPLLRADR